MRRDSGYADFRQMLDNQFIETRIKRRKQQYSRRRVSVERGHARVQRCSEWHGERRCQRIVEPGIEHLGWNGVIVTAAPTEVLNRSEEHTSELQSQSNLVCRLLLEKKKKTKTKHA